VTRIRARSEHVEQTTFVGFMKNFHPDALLAAVPNGGLRDARVGAKLKAEGVLPAFPDLVLMEPRGGYHGAVVEMKSATGRVTPDQSEMHARLRVKGYHVVVAHSADEALRKVERYLALHEEKDQGRWAVLG
jgi:hypothetical protein